MVVFISFLVALWIFAFEASLPHGLDRLERGFNRKSNAVRRNRQESKLFLCEFGYFEGIWRPSGCVRVPGGPGPRAATVR